MITIGLETQTVTISFMGSAAYIAALNQLQAKLGCTSRARLAMAALDALAKQHGEPLPARLNPKTYGPY